jgi:hypothetical protein
VIRLAALAVIAGACSSGPPAAVSDEPTRGVIVSDAGYPNVHARLRITQQAPALPRGEVEVEIWMAGSRFRVRDAGGRALHVILDELRAPRGLGVPARTIEDMMDRSSAKRRKPAGPTQLYGDLATGAGWVYPAVGERWEHTAAELAPAAEQLLARGRDVGLTAGAATRLLDRAATEYAGTLASTENGVAFESVVRRVLAPPFVLRDETRSATNPEHFFTREVLALDEGAVTEADLTPP